MTNKQRRYYELYQGKVTSESSHPIKYKAKPKQARKRDEAKELFQHLRQATFLLIGISNAIRRLATDFSGTDGSNWRNNRHVCKEVQEIAVELGKVNITDIEAVLRLENRLEEMYKACEVTQPIQWIKD